VPFRECSTTNPRQQILDAAQWLAEQPTAPKISPDDLKDRFVLTSADASEAVLLARRYRICRRAFG